MKQAILLERDDLAALKTGQTITLNVGGSEVILSYATPRPQATGARATDVTCHECGKVYTTDGGVRSHYKIQHGLLFRADGKHVPIKAGANRLRKEKTV